MTSTKERPISQNWTTGTVSGEFYDAKDVNKRLGEFAVSELTPELVPFIAAAAAELVHIAAIAGHMPGGEGVVALLRKIAKVAIAHPEVGGIHTHRLGELLECEARGGQGAS